MPKGFFIVFDKKKTSKHNFHICIFHLISEIELVANKETKTLPSHLLVLFYSDDNFCSIDLMIPTICSCSTLALAHILPSAWPLGSYCRHSIHSAR